jgi:hypothetical protein
MQSSGSTSSSRPISSSQSKSQAEETAKAVKDAAKAIRDAAFSTREAVKAFSDSGVVTGLAESIQAATKAARDTTQGMRDTSRELHEPKVVRAIHQTLSIVEETGDKANEAATLLSKLIPQTTGTPLKVTKRRGKSRDDIVTKKPKKRLTTDKTKSQTDFKELERKSNMSTKAGRKNRRSEK